MSRTLQDSLTWVEHGTKLVHEALAGLDDDGVDAPSALAGWSRRHVAAHLAANADAIGNLVRWAATGQRTPMYSSPDQRAADIETGSARTADELRAWFDASAERLAGAMAALGSDQWATEVVTAQGRTLPASEAPWLRAREVMVHVVDLRTGTTFADLPTDFIEALCADVVARRGNVPDVDGPLDQRAAWLTGRPHQLVDVPDLGAWL
jgi:maleylpyruvate isomerase